VARHGYRADAGDVHSATNHHASQLDNAVTRKRGRA
jgi:hypothetical protein